MKPYVKFCRIASPDAAQLATSMGASALGLVSAMPSGPGPIADALIARIAAARPSPIATFPSTCRQDAGSIIARHPHVELAALTQPRARTTASWARGLHERGKRGLEKRGLTPLAPRRQ